MLKTKLTSLGELQNHPMQILEKSHLRFLSSVKKSVEIAQA
jgi:hypothetical protein